MLKLHEMSLSNPPTPSYINVIVTEHPTTTVLTQNLRGIL